MSAAIAKPASLPVHDKEIFWLNQLILDLKLQLIGHENQMSALITMERLNEFSDIRRELYQCRRTDRIKR